MTISRQRSSRAVLAVGVFVACAGALIPHCRSRASAQVGPSPAQAPTSLPGETPIVDPGPEPVPLFLPFASQGFDGSQPPPLLPEVRGYVAALTRSGRLACAPATHVLLERPEGSSGNKAQSVIFASPERPDINLDLYITDYVVASGLEDLAPVACQTAARRLVEVRDIRSIPVPPSSAQAPAIYSGGAVGKRTITAIE